MGKTWFRLAEQDEYLREQVKELLKARLDQTVKDFRLKLYETWEGRWPEIKVIFPNRTDADPPLNKKQIDELANAMVARKKESLIAIQVPAVTMVISRLTFSIHSNYIPVSAG